MQQRLTKLVLMLACSVTLLIGLESSSDACLSCLFGHHRAYYAPSYGPFVPTVYYRSRVYYVPAYSSCYVPVCSPCIPCPSDCGVKRQPQPVEEQEKTWKPTDAPPMPKTDANDFGGDDGNDSGNQASPDDAGLDGRSIELPGDPTQREALKPTVNDPPILIQQRKGAPTTPIPPGDNSKQPGRSDDDPKKPNETGSLRIPELKLDNKLTSRSPVKLCRTYFRSVFHSPNIVRQSVVPNIRRPALPRGTKIVRK